MGGRLRDTGKYYRVHFLSCDGIIWNHTGAGYREYSRKGREDEKEVERFSRFCEEFANYEREPGQDMTLLVTADGKAVKKIYYTRIFYDRIAFQTQGSYIPPVYGNRGDDIREEMSRIPEPERPGYIFLGWEPELPETMPEGELTVHALWEPGESQYTVLRWMEHYEQSGALQGMHFLGVRDEFEAVSRSLDTFYFQDLAKMNHTFDAYPWLDNSAYPIFVTYFVEKQDGTFRRVGGESLMVDKDPDIHGAEVTVFHPTGLTCEEGWYTTGSSPEICENAEKIPVRPDQIQGDERCVFRSVGSHLYVYMKKDTFTLSYMDIDEDGRDLVYRTEDVKYKQEVSMTYEPEGLGLSEACGRGSDLICRVV